MSAVPAWKRLGLRLKGASSDESPVSAPSQTTPSSAPPAARFGYHQQPPNSNGGGQYGTPGFNKRKQFPPGPYPASDSKRPRRDEADLTPSKKTVSFSEDTKKAAPKKPKTKKAPKQQPPKQHFDFTPVLEYLRTWHKTRDSWKFNKNHQTLLIKHLYNSDSIPSSDIDAFYLYICDIKGASRKRLVEQAEEIRKKDMEAGSKGFPEGTKAPEEKQKQYEEVLADLLKRKAEIKESGEPANGTGKRSFDEVEFVLRTVDKEVQQRVVKRMRAETVIDKLESSDSGESTVMSTSASTDAASSMVKTPVANGDAKAISGKDGPKQKTKRRRKLRTADVDSSSESDSDSSDSSDSDSDSGGPAAAGESGGSSSSSSSSSSSDSDSDEEMENAIGLEDAVSSSSSSSSSESGSDSESEGSAAGAAVAQDDESGSDGDSESSDSDDEDA